MKIRCPDGTEKTVEECKNCPSPCHPSPVRHALLHGRDRKRKPKEKPAFGVTTLTTNCLRQSYYRLTEEEIRDLEKLWIFSRGHAMHEFVTKTLEEGQKEVFVKKKFPYYDIIGFIDALHEDTIHEFKTTSNLPQEPQKHHILQAQAYYSLLDELKQSATKKIIITYLSMNKIKHFEVIPRNILPWLKTRAAKLTQALKTNIPPPAEATWLCNYCDHKDLCDKENQVS
ncbi:Dna2/Cas4 domain-containing protein [Candidatus Woesearchaeota archaeon]|nr:Dna2/Cas4 domain-containing protein [Candidatus Woesearchaeota archaeon]